MKKGYIPMPLSLQPQRNNFDPTNLRKKHFRDLIIESLRKSRD